MRWSKQDERIRQRQQELSKWHRWFAWYPVEIAGQWVLFETVERRCWWDTTYYAAYHTHYRNLTLETASESTQ